MKLRLYRILFIGRTKKSNTQEQISEVLATERIYIKALMDNISDRIYFKDRSSRFLRINNALANHFNLKDPEQAVGKTDFNFFTEEHSRMAFEDEQMIIRTGQSIKMEEKETWENRPDTWVSTVKMPLQNKNGDIIGTFGISRDITDHKLTEIALEAKKKEIEAQNKEYQQLNEELQALNMELVIAKENAEKSDRLKSAFLRNISHEIRTPLNAIMGFSELLSSQFDNKAKLEEFSKTINLRCNDLMNIINGILDIAKIETGQLSINDEEFALEELFSELLSFFKTYQKRIQKQEIELGFNIDCALSGIRIVSDKTKLKQIFINLVENAFKFTNTGKILFGCTPNQNDELKFFVSDTGIGIPEKEQAFIFENFAQVEDGYSRIYGGTGLGLSIVKGMVELLGGKIGIESKLGKGSVFYFLLPYKATSTQQ